MTKEMKELNRIARDGYDWKGKDMPTARDIIQCQSNMVANRGERILELESIICRLIEFGKKV